MSDSVSLLIRVAYICTLQLVLMTVLSLLFYVATTLSYIVHNNLGVLEHVVPVFWRYKSFLIGNGHENEFPNLFSIYLMNIVVQAVFLIWICYLLFNGIDFRAAPRISLSRSLLFLILLGMSLLVTVEIFVGPLDLNSVWGPGVPDAPISVIAVFFRFCVLAPAANAFAAFMIVTRFGFAVRKLR